MNGVELYNGINTTPKAWSNSAVWASSNWNLGAKAKIKNAVLTTDGYKYSFNQNTIQKSNIHSNGNFGLGWCILYYAANQ